MAKIDRAGEDIYRIETVVPLAIAGFYAWILSRENCDTMPWWLYAIPPFLAVLGCVRYFARSKYIRACEEYIRMLECKLRGDDSDPEGWEHFYVLNGIRWYWSVRTVFWILVVIATTSVIAINVKTPGALCHQEAGTS